MVDAKRTHVAHNFQDLTGQRFSRLIVVSRAENSKHNYAMWNCICDCGAKVITVGTSLRKGNTKSCGCFSKDQIATLRRTHGMSQATEYRVWRGMITRCTNPNVKCYANYGKRGIVVCERWKSSFENFLADMGERPTPKHTLDRINNDGNYEPGNVRWAERKEQNRNQRSNIVITHNGITAILSEWAVITGIDYQTLHTRIWDGWSHERAITTPVRHRMRRAK